jgi:hypothetical protein
MRSDSGDFRSERGEYSDSLDGLFPVAQWYDPCESEFRCSDRLAACYSWSKRCARALDELRRNLKRFKYEEYSDFESLASAGHSYSFVTTLAALTIAQNELLTLQDSFGSITEQLAARRLLEFGDDGARSTVCGRPYPSALDGLLDVHKQVSVLVYPLGEPITSAVASAIPIVMSRTPLLVPFYAGCADNEIVPDDGLDPHSVRTLADYPDFREAVTRAYCKSNKPRIFSEIQAFDGQVVLAGIKAELSILSQARKAKPTALISTNDSDAQTSPTSSKPKGELKPNTVQRSITTVS